MFSLVYIGSLLGTLYASAVIQSTVLTAMCAAVQLTALALFVVSYVPGGAASIKVLGKLWWATITSIAIPVLKRVLPKLFS